MTTFFSELFARQESWRSLGLVERSGDSWRGLALSVPAPTGSGLAGALDIEVVADEITITLDYSHIHQQWPLKSKDHVGNVWWDPFALIDAILGERIVSVSGWIDGRLRVGSLRKIADVEKPLLVTNLHRRRVRSWKGTWNRDEALSD